MGLPYRAIDQHGQVIDVLLSRGVTWRPPGLPYQGAAAATVPAEVTTDRGPVYPRVLDELVPRRCTPWSSTRITRSREITGG